MSVLAPTAPVVQPKIIAASLFKNGYAVLTREIEIPAGGRALVTDIPEGSLGTVWLTTTDGLKLASVKNIQLRAESSTPAASVLELLTLNVGKEVRLAVDDTTTYDGKLLSATTDVLLLKSGDDVVALNPTQVRSVTVAGANTAAPRTSKKRALEIKVEGRRAGRMYMIALERGLTWSPAYSLDISDPKKLKFVSKAVLLDDIGDLHDIEARLVTGFPNVYFLPVADPLLASTSVDEYIRSLGMADAAADADRRNLGVSFGGQAAMAQNSLPLGGGGFFDAAQAMSHDNPAGFAEGDLFFYRQPHVTIRKGERAYYVLADATLPYKEIYTWDSADSVGNNNGYGYNQPNQPDPVEEIWHSVQFKNSVGQPLTTGPATTFKAGELMGQDMLKYTSTGSDALVKITKALDVHAESADEEIDRKRVALQVPGMGAFDLVTLRTVMKATNTKADRIHLKVTRPFTGEMVDGGDAKITKNVKGLRHINPTGKLVWERDVQPGKAVTLTFTTKVYVRSGG
ncbi:MAG: hypothetical protein ACYC96_07980 [Fimbriimonadaceae bacterium]